MYVMYYILSLRFQNERCLHNTKEYKIIEYDNCRSLPKQVMRVQPRRNQRAENTENAKM